MHIFLITIETQLTANLGNVANTSGCKSTIPNLSSAGVLRVSSQACLAGLTGCGNRSLREVISGSGLASILESEPGANSATNVCQISQMKHLVAAGLTG